MILYKKLNKVLAANEEKKMQLMYYAFPQSTLFPFFSNS